MKIRAKVSQGRGSRVSVGSAEEALHTLLEFPCSDVRKGASPAEREYKEGGKFAWEMRHEERGILRPPSHKKHGAVH